MRDRVCVLSYSAGKMFIFKNPERPITGSDAPEPLVRRGAASIEDILSKGALILSFFKRKW
jgi:hypothetical protein